jgi:SAM-dependent methyltransferase
MGETEKAIESSEQAALNADRWVRGEFVDFYATQELRPAEKVLLERHRDVLAGEVLELGSGAGRLTGHLCQIAEVVYGVELSAAMVAYCNQTYPQARVEEGDLQDLSRFESDSFDSVFAPFNVLDVLGDEDRGLVLDEIRRVLRADGLLLMSSHNLGFTSRVSPGIRLLLGSPRHPLQSTRGLMRRVRNRRRLRSLERVGDGYALRNDEAHDFSLLHYYISRDAQERQLTDHGFELLECLDLEGSEVPSGSAAAHCSELHYAARISQPV